MAKDAKTMKKTFLLIVFIITTACNNNVKRNAAVSSFDNKIDSVLLYLAKKYEIPYKLYTKDSTYKSICDSTHLQKSFPLFKKVFYKDLDLTFEFRQSADCHELLEIILCYNDSILTGIPIWDNYYYFRYKSDTTKYCTKLSFEKELNNAFAMYLKHGTHQINRQIPPEFYPALFVRAIMDNLTKFYCREIIPELGDFVAIKKRTKEKISDSSFTDNECMKNALLNIDQLENECKKSDGSMLLYYFMMNDCIYCFTFPDFNKTGKFISLKVINKECYYAMIF
jgi:hypothetical protein